MNGSSSPDQRANRLESPGFWANVKRWWRGAGYEPSPATKPSAGGDDAPLIVAAIDTRQAGRQLRERMLSAVRQLLQASPESRLACVSTIGSTPAMDGRKEAESASGIVRGHLVQLMQWARPLELPAERLSCHVLRGNGSGVAYRRVAQDNVLR